ncbi:MAG: DUF4394 domain-containing protein [Luteolibacter sp.]
MRNFTNLCQLPSWRSLAFLFVACSILVAGGRAGAAIFPVQTTFYLLTEDGSLVITTRERPDILGEPQPLAGVVAGDVLVAIDVRPQNQDLYALGVNATADTVRLYHITPETNVATPLGTGPASFVTAAAVAVDMPATGWDMDINPVADRVRVVNASGLSFRLNPNTGGAVDGDNGLGAGSVAGVNPDGVINGLATSVDGAAYTNNRPNSSITTLYTLSAQTNSLYIQNPANSGTQTAAVPVLVGGSPFNFTAVTGFDIPPGVDAAASNAPASGTGYAVMRSLSGSFLYSIDLTSGQAVPLSGILVRSLAIRTRLGAGIALSGDGSSLVRFNPAVPGTTTTVAVSGITAGEILVGIDGRPSTGQLLGLGVNATANTATLYLIDPQIASLSAIGASGSIAFVDGIGSPVDLPDPSVVGYGMDVNPAVDRVRVTTGSGLNFRVNPVTGVPVDGDSGGSAGSTVGVNTDGSINAGTAGIQDAAYTNSYAGTAVTTLYTLDSSSKKLFIQNPPNAGTQVSGLAVTLGGVPLNFSAVGGFDIPREIAVTVNSTAATGKGWAAFTAGGTTGLYRINLADGAADFVGVLGSGTTPAGGLVMWAIPPAAQYGFVWDSDPGSVFSIETSTDLSASSWLALPGTLTAGGSSVFTVVAAPAADEPRRFWRARKL